MTYEISDKLFKEVQAILHIQPDLSPDAPLDRLGKKSIRKTIAQILDAIKEQEEE